jgi:hypothetical protein
MPNIKMQRTFTAGDPDKWTLSVWLKKTKRKTDQVIFQGWEDSNNYCVISFGGNDEIQFNNYISSTLYGRLKTTRKYSDPSAYYHLTFIYDSNNSTAGDRMQIWTNGVRETAFDNDDNPTLDRDSVVNGAGDKNNLFVYDYDSTDTQRLAGYCAQMCFSDGQAYTPSTFGSFDSATGEWGPKSDSQLRSAVTFGTNGFLLTFQDASNLGYDYQTAARSTTNDFTTHGTGVQSIDNPSNNFNTQNPQGNWIGYFSGASAGESGIPNLVAGATSMDPTSGAHSVSLGTLGSSSMKYYYEMNNTVNDCAFGAIGARPNGGVTHSYNDITANGFYPYDGQKIVNGTWSAGGTGFTGTGFWMIAVDPAGGKMWIGKDGTWNGDPSAGTSPLITGMNSSINNETILYTTWGHIHNTSTTMKFNFGMGYFATSAAGTNADANSQGKFKYTVPTGFFALCSKNLKEQNG